MYNIVYILHYKKDQPDQVDTDNRDGLGQQINGVIGVHAATLKQENEAVFEDEMG